MKKVPMTVRAPGAGEQLSYFQLLPFCPAWPSRCSLADKALGLLMDGHMIDYPNSWDATASWRLGAVVFTLRTLGWPVEIIEIPSSTQQSPACVIKLYRLDRNYTAQALAMNGRAV